MFKLDNQVALVTGATGSIGFAIAEILHKNGATVVLSGSRENVLEEHQRKLGDRVLIEPCDLSQKDQTQGLVDRVISRCEKVDIVVNNAGITKDNLFIRMSDEDWHKVISINLDAAFYICRSAVKHMMKQRYGRIINISSVVGFSGNPGQTNYTASKAALVGMSKSIAAEVASRGVTVNCIAPGFITSDMTNVLNDTQKQAIAAKIPMGSIGESADIAAAALYLASKEAKYITGQTIHVNGGMLML